MTSMTDFLGLTLGSSASIYELYNVSWALSYNINVPNLEFEGVGLVQFCRFPDESDILRVRCSISYMSCSDNIFVFISDKGQQRFKLEKDT